LSKVHKWKVRAWNGKSATSATVSAARSQRYDDGRTPAIHNTDGGRDGPLDYVLGFF
jgi:hypothetical protein